MMTLMLFAQGMTDSQVADVLRQEMAAGRNQAQIVTKLVQREVQIRIII